MFQYLTQFDTYYNFVLKNKYKRQSLYGSFFVFKKSNTKLPTEYSFDTCLFTLIVFQIW